MSSRRHSPFASPGLSMWQMLQISAALDHEFLGALSKYVPALGWIPSMKVLDLNIDRERPETLYDPPADVCRFPLQRGFYRWPFSLLANVANRQIARMSRAAGDELHSPLICTTPYWAPVAEKWHGPVVYYLTDLMAAYGGADESLVRSLDIRMCHAATLVCPNSQRIADYLRNEAACPESRIAILPNATRSMNVFQECPSGPSPLPPDLADMHRPVAGVIGNLSSNMDWVFLSETIALTPEYSWALAGPTDMPISDDRQNRARAWLLSHGGRVRFVGGKKYGELRDYARAFDVAVLPYFRREPTYSGSSTRFYEHLAACRPMIATRGFAELLGKEPLLRLVGDAREASEVLSDLHCAAFDDGLTQARWQAGRNETWEARALCMIETLERRLPEFVADEAPANVDRVRIGVEAAAGKHV